MNHNLHKEHWDYIGDVIVGVVADCDCPKPDYEKDDRGLPLQFYPDAPHESHDVVPPIEEHQLPEGVTMERYIERMKLVGIAPELLALVWEAYCQANGGSRSITLGDEWINTAEALFEEVGY